jgi:SAM-dependent methyltransferase
MRLPAFLRRARHPLSTGLRPPDTSDDADRTERAASVLRRTEEFNRNAETYWRDVKDDPAGRRHVLNRPLGNVGEAAHALYRLGLVLAELRPGLGHTVLDFAAGSGWLSAWLNRLGCRTIALDVSPTALELARAAFALDARQRPELQPEFLAYDGRRLPLPDASVDRVVSFDGFHHVPNPEEMLKELARVLRLGGIAVFAEPGEGHAEAEASRLETVKAGVLENELDVATFARWAEAAGFTDVRL